MDNAIYVGLSRQMTLQRAMDVTANNIANLDTAGFKVESLTLNEDPETPVSAPATQPISYVLDKGLARNFGQGSLETTGNPLDLAIDGPGFFSVKTGDGVRYTRDGRFTLDPTGTLTDKLGHPLLDSGGAPIVLNPQNGAPTISRDGVVSQTAANGQAVQVGKVGVVRFADLAGLSKEGGDLFSAAAGQTPQPASDARIRQGMVEKSNVQPVNEIVHLIAITRAYQSVANMLTQTADLSEAAVTRLGKAA